MPIGGMQNRLRRIPRPSRRLGHRRGNFQATDNVPGLSRNPFSMGVQARERPPPFQVPAPRRNPRRVLGELVQATAGKWITHPPTRCPNGHRHGPGDVLVSHQACLGHGGGHTTWTCRTCDQMVYGPPVNTHCTCLDGQRQCGSPPPRAQAEVLPNGPLSKIPTDGGPIQFVLRRLGLAASSTSSPPI
jgi:hypothetical protein